MMSKPIAVLISDIHYNIQTLELADASMRMAINRANTLNIPLIVAGDLHDTKANIRGECVNAMLKTFSLIKTRAYIIVGNHDRLNEKAPEHSLNFLQDKSEVIDTMEYIEGVGYLLPYFHDPDELRLVLEGIDKDELIIMHQGLQSSNPGDYIQDKSAIAKEDVAGRRIISGHYHTRQTTQLPDGGQWDYIGNPYTLTYGEANDPTKGCQILNDEGSLTFIPTNLRKHCIYEIEVSDIGKRPTVAYNDGDLIWVKVHGTKEQLLNIDKSAISQLLDISSDFRLELIPESTTATFNNDTNIQYTQSELLDCVIDSLTNTSEDRRMKIKTLWRDILSTS